MTNQHNSGTTAKLLKSSEVRVLVVDDNRLSLALIAGLIRHEGIPQLFTAKSGEEAIEKVKEIKPHVVFLDIELGTMDGFQVMQEIHKISKFSQIVMVTATATAARVQSANNSGVVGFIVKPVSQKRIGDAILESIKRIAALPYDVSVDSSGQ